MDDSSTQITLHNNILAITMVIREKYPSIYKLLEETPLFQSDAEGVMDARDYMQTLKIQLTTLEKYEEVP